MTDYPPGAPTPMNPAQGSPAASGSFVPGSSTPGFPSQSPIQPPPSATPPPSKGLPGWAWAVIIGGGVLFIGFIISIVVMSTLFFTAVANQEDCSLPGSCGQGLPPEQTAEANPTPTSTPESSTSENNVSPSTGDRISLDELADFGGPPVWEMPLKTSWEIDTVDQNGVSTFIDSETQCFILTSQDLVSSDKSATSDRSFTEDELNANIETFTAAATDVTFLGSSTVDIGIFGTGTIEFATTAFERTVFSGEVETVEILARSMPASDANMFIYILCPTEVYQAGNSPFDYVVDNATVTPSF